MFIHLSEVKKIYKIFLFISQLSNLLKTDIYIYIQLEKKKEKKTFVTNPTNYTKTSKIKFHSNPIIYG